LSILTAVPQQLRAGDSLRLLIELADYPAPTWTTALYLENATGSKDATGSPSGTSHAFTIAATDTAVLKPGSYKWILRASSGSVAETALEGWLEVLPNLAGANAVDHRSWARQALDAVQATLLGRATDGQLAMTLNGRSINRIPLAELKDWRTQLRTEVRSEAGGARGSRDMKVRFRRA
jgi:hypothetical protein